MKALSEEFISEYARLENISPAESRRRIDAFVTCISNVLLRVGVVNLRRLGVFSVRTRKNAKYHNNHTGINETIPIRKVVSFRPSDVIKRKLNAKVKENIFVSVKAKRDGEVG